MMLAHFRWPDVAASNSSSGEEIAKGALANSCGFQPISGAFASRQFTIIDKPSDIIRMIDVDLFDVE